MKATRLATLCVVVSVPVAIGLFAADQADQQEPKKEQRETVSKGMTERQRKKKEAQLRKELETPYRKWLNEDVAYIITDEERAAFKRLQTDRSEERRVGEEG